MTTKAAKIAKPSSATDVVEAVVFLRQPKGKGVPVPAVSRELAARALKQAKAVSGVDAEASVVFDAMHSLSVRASRSFVDALAKSTDVAEVVQNKMAGSALIRPVGSSKARKSPL